MFRSKKDVDRHVQDILGKIHNENEKNLRGYSFARFYYQVKEYETAKRYLSNYLSVRDHHAPSHKLMGQIHEALGDKEKALQSYKRTLEVDPNQKEVVLKICELYCHLPVDHETARYWVDRADQLFPHHSTVFQLRECMVSAEGQPDRQELEKLLESELLAQPHNLDLRIKLLRLYLDTERVRVAYDHVVKIERKNPFPSSVDWYYLLADVFEAYAEEVGQELDSNFYILYLTALDHLVYLTLAEPHLLQHESSHSKLHVPTINDAASALLQFDQCLKAASEKDLSHGAWLYFLNHMKGQLYYHFGCLIIKRAKKDQSNWKEASRVGAALLLVGYTFKPGSLLQEAWFSQMDEQQKVFTKFFQQASVRTSFIGHVILSLCDEDKTKWLQKIKQDVCLHPVRERTYNRLLSNVNKSTDASKSYFLNDPAFLQSNLELPVPTSLLECDKACFTMCSGSLHHLVWLRLHLEDSDSSDFIESSLREAFKGLRFSNSHMSKGSPESLCLLDVESFLLATVYTTNLYLEQRSAVNAHPDDLSLPPDVSDPLCTDDQAVWWKAAHGLVNNTAKEKLGEHRRILQRGLEVIRGIGNHGLELQLVIHLARLFADRALALSTDSGNGNRKSVNENEKLVMEEVSGLENRAQHYWNMALSMLEKLESGNTMRVPKVRMFCGYSKPMSSEEITLTKEEGKLFLGVRHFNAGHFEEAAEVLEKLSLPEASYHLVLTYKKLAMQESATSTARGIFLNKARSALYATMDRVSGDPTHWLNDEIYRELDDIESELDKQMNEANANNSGNESEVDELNNSTSSLRSSAKSRNRSHRLLSHSTPKSASRFLASRAKGQRENSVDRTHLEPSPERLDAQIRALTLTQSTLVKTLLEQQRSLLDTNKAIIEELKQNKEVVVELKKQLEELQISAKKQQPVQRKATAAAAAAAAAAARAAQGDDEEDHYEYEENGILDYYMEDGVDGYRQSYYGFTQPRVMTDASRTTIGYVPQATLPPGPPAPPPPLAPYSYQYPPPPHGIAPPPAHGLAAQPPPPAQPGSLTDPQHYYTAPLPHGLPFSEGQPLPQFRFHVASSVVKPTVVSTLPSVPPTAAVPVTNVQSFQSIVPPPPAHIPPTSVQPSTQWTRTGTVPHAFQIPLPPTTATPVSCQPMALFAAQSSLPAAVSVAQSLAATLASQVPAPSVVSASMVSASQLQALLSSPPSSSTGVTAGQVPVDSSLGKQFPVFKGVGFSPPAAAAANIATPEVSRSRQDSEACSDTDVEREVMGDFKPVIPLPAEVTVCTGEEEEEVLFETRAKLFRFVDHEWKERGIGTVKFLKHEPSGKVRLLMRRDQVHKICANHYILPTMELTPLKGSDKAYMWAANDFADETVKLEQFCIRFKTPDIAVSFKKAFEDSVKYVKEKEAGKTNSQPDADIVPSISAIATTTDTISSTTAPVSTLQGEPVTAGMPKPGSWTCPTCYVSNEANKINCIACETEKPDSGNEVSASTNAKSPFTIGSGISASLAGRDENLHSFEDKPFVFQTQVISVNDTGSKQGSGTLKDTSLKPTVGSFSSTVEVAVSNSSSQPHSSCGIFSNFSFSTSEITTEWDPKETSVSACGQSQVTAAERAKTTSVTFLNSPSSFTAVDLSQKVSPAQVTTSCSSTSAVKPVSVFGGFTFTSTPVVTEKTPDSKDREILTVSSRSKEGTPSDKAESKPSPFLNFSFKPSATSTVSKASDKPKPEEGVSKSDNSSATKQGNDHVFGSGSNVADLQFSSISKSGSGNAFKSAGGNASFPGAGSPLFVTVTNDGRRVSGGEASTEAPPEEFVPTAEFKPVIPLPDLVDVKTGEEGEEVLFKERAKLFRYDVSLEEWKERGIGELKILHLPKTNKYRIVMRRDQVLKLCANHNILPEMKLSPMATSEKAWVWFAQDFAEGEIRHEKFAARFKSADIAAKFHSTFEQCRSELLKAAEGNGDGSSAEKEGADRASHGTTIKEAADAASEPCAGNKENLADLFRPEAGSWECPSCYVRNGKNAKVCEACETPRPGTTKSENKLSMSSAQPASTVPVTTSPQAVFGAFRFTSVPTTTSASFVFGKNESSKPFSSGFVFGSTDSSVSQSPFQQSSSNVPSNVFGFKPNLSATTTSSTASVFGGVAFGGQSSSSSNLSSVPKVTAAPTFVFGSVTSAVSSSTASAPATSLPATKPEPVFSFGTSTADKHSDSVEFRFGSPQKYEFNFSGVRPHSPTKCPKSPKSPGTPTDAEEEDEVEPSDADGIYFQPVIPLPPKVELRTGEEDEAVLFSKRAKLFRFVDNEWKERGVGDVKILYNESQKTYRLLMRRDQVLKVCLNHYLTKETAFSWKGDKSLSWAAIDHSENEPNLEQFAIRFKTAELAAEFKEAIDSVLQNITSPSAADREPTQTSQASTSSSLANFSFKLPPKPEVTPSSTRDSVRKCLDFTLDSVDTQQSAKDADSQKPENKDKFSFTFSIGGGGQQAQSSSSFSLTSKIDSSSSSSAPTFGTKSAFFTTAAPSTAKATCADPDVEIIYEAKPTPEEVALAEKLMLPRTFFLYKNKPPCPGCRGCEEGKLAATKSVEAGAEQKAEKNELSGKEEEQKQPQPEPSIFSNSSVSSFSFADLASKSSEFDALKSVSPSAKIVFPGAGTPVFGSTSHSNEDEDGDVVQGPDVHFEPVIPLPNIVEVKTGEEEETVLFCSRGKLYRYDTESSQWKERALGEMKILQNKKKQTFRLLMRREQVLKVACNHLITPALKLEPMVTSENALCWLAIDYSEGEAENAQFAIRFKLKDTLLEFKDTIEKCKAMLLEQNQKPADAATVLHDDKNQPDQKASQSKDAEKSSAQIHNGITGNDSCVMPASLIEELAVPDTEGASGGLYDPEAEEYDEEEEDDDEEDIVFVQNVAFEIMDETSKEYQDAGSGILQVLYDDTVFGYRIIVTQDSNNEILCDHVIAVQTCLRSDRRSATWSAVDICVDPPRRRQFRATFASPQALDEFSAVFEDGKRFAIQSEIVEKSENIISAPTTR